MLINSPEKLDECITAIAENQDLFANQEEELFNVIQQSARFDRFLNDVMGIMLANRMVKQPMIELFILGALVGIQLESLRKMREET